MATRMNVVILSDTGKVNGGAAKVALDDARGLSRAGCNIVFVCGAGPVSTELTGMPNVTAHSMGEFDIVDDPNRLRAAVFGLWNPRTYGKVREILKPLDPDQTIVHLHSWTKALSSSAVRAAIDGGFDVVITVHDFLLSCPTGTLFLQNEKRKCDIRPMSVKCVCTNCDVQSYQHKVWRVGRKIVQTQFGRIPSGIRHYIVYSETPQKLLERHLPKGAVFHRIRAAIGLEKLGAAKVRENRDFVFLGRMTQEKGVEMFARAAAAEAVPCAFMGDGPMRGSVLEANPAAKLRDWGGPAEAIGALREARALVFPSLWYETLGLVVLEAAANGIPAIVPDTCAARDSVTDGETGLHFKSGDEADLRRKIALLSDPERAARMGAKAYERFWAAPGWSMAYHTSQLLATYRNILSARCEEGSAELVFE